MKVELNVAGMHCEACVRHVTRALREMAGVSQAIVSLADECAVVEYDPSVVTPENMTAAVADEGYQATVAE